MKSRGLSPAAGFAYAARLMVLSLALWVGQRPNAGGSLKLAAARRDG